MILSLFAGLVVVGGVVALVTSAFAPLGYEDAVGFHYGTPAMVTVSEWDAAASQAAAQPA